MNKPNPKQLDALRTRIGELCGTLCPICNGTGVTPITGQTAESFEYGGSCDCAPLPNYPEDLNAMHEAEKALLTTRDLLSRYEDKLDDVVSILPEEGATGSVIDLIVSEAWQRCAAIDRCLSEKPIL